MRVKLNKWLSYEEWFKGKLVFKIGKVEFALSRPGHNGGRWVLAHILGPRVMLGIVPEDIQALCSFFSEAERENENKQE
jgi:hypothetical protein